LGFLKLLSRDWISEEASIDINPINNDKHESKNNERHHTLDGNKLKKVINNKKYLKKIFIVTFPHKNHLEGNYKVNVSNIIDELNLSPKIIHINFNEIIQSNRFQKENIYAVNDPASHLNEEAHALYIKKIFKIIKEKKY